MFDEKIDVAAIMREIKQKAAKKYGFADENARKSDFVSDDPEEKRIQDFVRNTYVLTERINNSGPALQSNGTNNRLIGVIVIFVKRIIRKLLFFIILWQKEINMRMNSNIKALSEWQETQNQKYYNKLAVLLKETDSQSARLTAVENNVAEFNHSIKSIDEIKDRLSVIEASVSDGRELLTSIEKMKEKLSELELNEVENKRLSGLVSSVGNDVIQLTDKVNHIQTTTEKVESKLLYTPIGGNDYLNFEDIHRGSEQEITKRLYFYFENYFCSLNKDKVILDLGCGRGEWLDLLYHAGCRAIGVDINSEMVNLCKQKGHNAVYSDAGLFIKGLGDNSLAAVTAFQVFEHLFPQQQEEIIIEAGRVLISGGILVIEVPNTSNVQVAADTFYSDITHIRPVNPNYLEFMAKKAGFNKTKIVYWKQKEIDEWFESVLKKETTDIMDSSVFRTVLEDFRKSFYNCPDYALIAFKE